MLLKPLMRRLSRHLHAVGKMKMDYLELRKRNWAYFSGLGLDIGPFDKPFIPDPAALKLTVETVDRWAPADLKRVFPEIQDSVVADPTYVYDVSAGGLGFAPDQRYDFVICSHVLEHVANPLHLLAECARVLKNGGVLYVSVPDGRYSDDQGRALVDYPYLLDLYRSGRTDIPDQRVMDYLRAPRICTGWVKEVIDNNAVTPEILDNERLSSFHVHVWDSALFMEHLVRFSADASLGWELLDLSRWEENGYEAVLILRKTPGTGQARFAQSVADRIKAPG